MNFFSPLIIIVLALNSYRFPWPRVKPLFVGKLEDAMSKFHRDLPADHLPPCPNVENPKFKEMRKRIIDSVNKFSG